MIYELGRMCVKLAGRDAGKRCVIIDVLNEKFVLIDGETRRRKCNVLHLLPTDQVLKIKKGISHADLAKELKKLDMVARESKPRKAGERPRKKRKSPEELRKQKQERKKEEESKQIKKVEKKEEKADEAPSKIEEKVAESTKAKDLTPKETKPAGKPKEVTKKTVPKKKAVKKSA